jgi:ABC-type uncharacterized transport system YnjBCD substrate-binding protein
MVILYEQKLSSFKQMHNFQILEISWPQDLPNMTNQSRRLILISLQHCHHYSLY